MIEQLTRKFVTLLLNNNLISITEYEEFLYVLLGDVESLVIIVSILFFSTIVKQVIPTISFLVFFFTLRKRTGGYHLKSYFTCYIGTLCLYVIITVIAYMASGCTKILIGFAMIATLIIIWIGSINHPNMDMENDELQNSKKMSRIIVASEFSIILFLRWTGCSKMIIAYSSLAIILCTILLIFAKLTGQEVKKSEGR